MTVEALGEAYAAGWRVLARWWSDRRPVVQIQPGMHLPRRARHGVAGLDPRTGFPAREVGRSFAVPALRVAVDPSAIRTAIEWSTASSIEAWETWRKS
jgi:hypothetical protein